MSTSDAARAELPSPPPPSRTEGAGAPAADRLAAHLEALRGRFLPVIRRRLAARVRAAHDAEDVWQEVCLSVLRGRFRWIGDAAFRRFVRVVVVRAAADAARATLGRDAERPATAAQGRDCEFLPGRFDDPARGLEAEERAARLGRAIARLGPRQRAVLTLAATEGLAPAEIAARLRAGEATVRKAYVRGLRALRRTLGGDLAPPCG
ncbi:MAG TPA: sigma-70 family RNA polymerase sigma factor [Planctomycetota bacterium]|nr:sigma-70 family RNA polymerase sigma factor [Planctomycetota bacterium]